MLGYHILVIRRTQLYCYQNLVSIHNPSKPVVFFLWRIIALQNFVAFCQTSTWISHRYTYQFSRSVMSDSLWPHGRQHTRPLVHHRLLEFTQTHVHWVGDAIHPSHPLSSPSRPAFNLSQHQSLFKWVSSLHFCIRPLYLLLWARIP